MAWVWSHCNKFSELFLTLILFPVPPMTKHRTLCSSGIGSLNLRACKDSIEHSFPDFYPFALQGGVSGIFRYRIPGTLLPHEYGIQGGLSNSSGKWHSLQELLRRKFEAGRITLELYSSRTRLVSHSSFYLSHQDNLFLSIFSRQISFLEYLWRWDTVPNSLLNSWTSL